MLKDALAFRGGTALYKLYLRPAARYSEDIDLVQVRAEPPGPVMEALRAVLDPWLGAPRWKQTQGRVTFIRPDTLAFRPKQRTVPFICQNSSFGGKTTYRIRRTTRRSRRGRSPPLTWST